jgi:hypothetical protein
MIAIDPERAQQEGAPRTRFRAKKKFFYLGKTFRKIGEQLCCDFAFVPARAQNSRHGYIFLL